MKKKTLIMLLCGALIIGSSAFGTIAYLTSQSQVTNKFTIGDVDIDVDETIVTPDGVPAGDQDGDGVNDRTTDVNGEEGNEYHLIPAQTYTKDPQLTVLQGSEESYVRMLVTITHYDAIETVFGDTFMPGDHVEGYDAAKWLYINKAPSFYVDDTGANVQTMTYEFRYHTTVAGKDSVTNTPADVKLEKLFTSFTVPGEVTGDQLQQLLPVEIRVIGQAIQKQGFADENAAWAEFPAVEGSATIPVTTTTTTTTQQGDAAGV